MPLKGIFLQVTFPKVPRYGIMAIQLLTTLTTVHHLFKCEIVVYLVNLPHLFHPIPLDVCFVSQPARCINVSFRELIPSCSIFEKIDSCRISFSRHRVGQRPRRQRYQDQHLPEGRSDHEDRVSLCPSVFLPHDLNLGTRFLFSRGELSHP